MCNAWNHPINCSCGWGGDGHQGKRTTGNSLSHNPWIGYLSFTGVSSYTNPNATCPVCGEPVFFYQSASGGKVFFDELGPPWPKHPCTDNPRAKFPTPNYIFQTEVIRPHVWQKNGWVPFIVKRLLPQFKLFNIRGDVNGVELSLYTTVKGLNEKAPFLVKRIDDTHYEVTTIQFVQHSAIASEFNFIGYSSAMMAASQSVQNAAKGTIDRERRSPSYSKINPLRPLGRTSVAARKPPSRIQENQVGRPATSRLARQERSPGQTKGPSAARTERKEGHGSERRTSEPQGSLQLALLGAGLKKSGT
jgi:hypothetical protein